MSGEGFPSAAGSYVLVLRLTRPISLQVGRLGVFTFPPAFYTYCGSALGSGGLRGRLKHHLANSVSVHWHVDYLRRHCKVWEVDYLLTDERMECLWSRFFLSQEPSFVPVPDFGAGDCQNGCLAHLIGFPEDQISQILRNFALAWNCQRLPMR